MSRFAKVLILSVTFGVALSSALTTSIRGFDPTLGWVLQSLVPGCIIGTLGALAATRPNIIFKLLFFALLPPPIFIAVASARTGIEFPSQFHFLPAFVGLCIGVSLAVLTHLVDKLRSESSENRRQADQAKQQAELSNERLEQFLEASTDWFWEMDENLKFSWVSESAADYFLDYRALMIGKGRAIGEALYGPNDLALHRKRLEARLPFRDFIYSPSFSGEKKWVQTSGLPIFDDQGSFAGYRGTAADVTELVRNRKVIETERNLLASVVENLEFPFALWDPDNKLIFGNQSLKTAIGPIGKLLVPGLEFSKFAEATAQAGFSPDEGRSEEQSADTEYDLDAGPNAGEYLAKTPEGRYFLTSILTLKNKCTIILARDVTAEKRNAERLEQATSQVAVWDWDAATDQMFASPILKQWLGYGDEDFKRVIQKNRIEIMHDSDRARYLNKVQSAIENQDIEFSDEHRLRCSDGSYCDIYMVGQFSYDREGNVTRWSGILTNETEKKLLEDQLRQSQKLQSIGRLSGGIAHDFNNILAIIMGNLELLVETATSDQVIELAQSSIRAIENGADLTNKMLSFARKAPLEKELVSLNELIKDLATIVERSISKNIHIEYNYLDQLPPVLVDRKMAQNALLNLILNARDSISDQGEIQISTNSETIPEGHTDLNGEAVNAGAYQTIVIVDNGSGISADNLGRVLEPFFTTKSTESGSGLGLSMVHGFMKQVEGYIEITSEIGVGTRVKLFFPFQESA